MIKEENVHVGWQRRVDGTMYSCTSLGVKLGGGIGTAITGWQLAFSGYDEDMLYKSTEQKFDNVLYFFC